jgi:dihydroorotate dehydrogenase electron transfer subunit
MDLCLMNNNTEIFTAPVISNDIVAENVNLLWLEAPGIAQSCRPGQFVMLKCGDGTLLRRPLSIHRVSADKTRLAFLFAVVGKGTEWLSRLAKNDALSLLGPLGNGFTLTSESSGAVLVAGGLGIAPLGFLAEELQGMGKKVTFLYGAATSSTCIDSAIPERLSPLFSTEDGSRGRKGFITSCLEDYLQENNQVFACGPVPMYKTLAKMDTLHNRVVEVSLETRMACGLGVCYGCSVETSHGLRQVCSHGPVFNLGDVIWDNLKDL